MKYKVGDRVKIKSLDWYNENKDEDGYVDCDSFFFDEDLSNLCNKIVTIEIVCEDCYMIKEDATVYVTDEMIECLVEEEKPLYKALVDKDGYMTGEFVRLKETKQEITCPDGYIFKDENGNVINAMKIVLEKKKKEYPKTYEECREILKEQADVTYGYKKVVLHLFQKLIVCRDAYWKIAGEEMGLGKPWEPDWDDDEWPDMYYISWDGKCLEKEKGYPCCNMILIFPTEEMRDAFYENFKELIESCKELL